MATNSGSASSGKEPRQHYYPASLIGEFGNPTDTRTGRERKVWVARRAAARVFASTGRREGVDESKQAFYGPAAHPDTQMLERFWQKAESSLPQVRTILEGISNSEAVPAQYFIGFLVPYCAHLLARQPQLWTPTDVGIVATTSAPDRIGSFFRLTDALLYSRTWQLLESADVPLVATDAGWLWLPGKGMSGTIMIPLSPSRAVLVSGGDPSYYYGDEMVTVDRAVMSQDQVRLLRDAMIIAAPSAVYAPTRDLAQYAWDLLADPTSAPTTDGGVNPQDIANLRPNRNIFLAFEGGMTDPMAAFRRFLAANHLKDCQCDEALREQGFNRTRRRTYLRHHDSEQRRAVKTLPRRATGS